MPANAARTAPNLARTPGYVALAMALCTKLEYVMFCYDDDDLDKRWETGNSKAPYRKTYEFPGTRINESHRAFGQGPKDDDRHPVLRAVPGKLGRACALKLYEFAYFAKGDVADIGTNRGLSSAVLASALRDSGSSAKVWSVDMSPKMARKARSNHALVGIENVQFATAEAADWLDQARNFSVRFGFAFIDHGHKYEPVRRVCERIETVLTPGAFIAFHDFLGRQFEVYPAVRATLPASFRFYGVCGCMGLFRLEPPALSTL